ncbi:MAG: hypothetical protein ACKO32_11445 [Planctomycetia bacterium]|jgi:hypothetical protein
MECNSTPIPPPGETVIVSQGAMATLRKTQALLESRGIAAQIVRPPPGKCGG